MLLVSKLLEGTEHETVPSKDNSFLLSTYLGTLLGTLKDFSFHLSEVIVLIYPSYELRSV